MNLNISKHSQIYRILSGKIGHIPKRWTYPSTGTNSLIKFTELQERKLLQPFTTKHARKKEKDRLLGCCTM